MKRALFLASGAALLGGCAQVSNALNDNGAIHAALVVAEPLDHAVIGTHGNAQLYPDSAIDWNFRLNGFDTPSDARYQSLVRDGFASYQLAVEGEIERPERFTLRELRALQAIGQTTRHDCVEGWSAVGKWSGVPLGKLLALVRPTPKARFVVFHCFDRDPSGTPYYESLDLHQAAHPQTQLALDLNGKPLDPDHGAPVRLKIPTQLGYKSAKWVYRLHVVPSLAGIFDGKGGYWEDNGYEWYAGI